MTPGPPKRRASGTWPPRGPARVLVVMDRPTLARLIALTLNHGLYDTRTVASAAEVAAPLAAWQPHLVVVDMDVDGLEVLALVGVRSSGGTRLPVIALTRRGDLKGKLAAFTQGVDDILVVPFSPPELLARVVALLRRSYDDAVTFTPAITLGELEIDILNRTVRAGTSELHLTSLEQSLLYLLATNAGRVVTREEILDTLWGTDYVAESNVVDRQIRNLRTRLQDDWRRPRFIATVPGRGYRFLPTFTDDAPGAIPDPPEVPAQRRRRQRGLRGGGWRHAPARRRATARSARTRACARSWPARHRLPRPRPARPGSSRPGHRILGALRQIRVRRAGRPRRAPRDRESRRTRRARDACRQSADMSPAPACERTRRRKRTGSNRPNTACRAESRTRRPPSPPAPTAQGRRTWPCAAHAGCAAGGAGAVERTGRLCARPTARTAHRAPPPRVLSVLPASPSASPPPLAVFRYAQCEPSARGRWLPATVGRTSSEAFSRIPAPPAPRTRRHWGSPSPRCGCLPHCLARGADAGNPAAGRGAAGRRWCCSSQPRSRSASGDSAAGGWRAGCRSLAPLPRAAGWR
ncbi:MAG: response regulator transcription factor [Chloroflexi bacterium]|nr:response regulator transcription factor [Chloroflexota bacterium]